MRNIQQVLERWGAGLRAKVAVSTIHLFPLDLRICYLQRKPGG